MGVVTSTWPLAHPALYLQQTSRLAAPQCISGRTSYLHVRLAFHPYPQVIPQFCNTGGCAPRRLFTAASRCPWIAHVVSGPFNATAPSWGRPLQTRFPSGCPAFPQVNPCDAEPLAGSFYKRHAISPCWFLPEWPLTACEYAVSGSLSSPSRGAFHLSLTVLVHYRSLKVFSLGGWSPLLPTNSPGFVVLRIPARSARLPLQGSHLLRRRVPTPSGLRSSPPAGPTTPRSPKTAWFGLFPPRSPLLRESRLISLRRATEMFQFAHCPPACLLHSAGGVQTSLWTGCPIRILRARRSHAAPPERFAGLRVLLRPSAPRHPPRPLARLCSPGSLLRFRASLFPLLSSTRSSRYALIHTYTHVRVSSASLSSLFLPWQY